MDLFGKKNPVCMTPETPLGYTSKTLQEVFTFARILLVKVGIINPVVKAFIDPWASGSGLVVKVKDCE